VLYEGLGGLRFGGSARSELCCVELDDVREWKVSHSLLHDAAPPALSLCRLRDHSHFVSLLQAQLVHLVRLEVVRGDRPTFITIRI